MLPITIIAQESTAEKKYRVKIFSNENGHEKSIDTTFTSENKDSVEKYLNDLGWEDKGELHEFKISGLDDIEIDGAESFKIFIDGDDDMKEFRTKIREMDNSNSAELKEIQIKLKEQLKRFEESGKVEIDLKHLNNELLDIANQMAELVEDAMENSMHHKFMIFEGEEGEDFEWHGKSDFSFDKKCEHKIDGEGTEMIIIKKQVEGSDKEEGSKKEKKVIVRDINSSKDKHEHANDIKFYPNPSNGKFNIEFLSEKEENIDLKVMDSNGKVVYKKKLKNFKGQFSEEIDLKEHADGIYIIDVEKGKEKIRKKILLKK